jgi:phosphatidate cytidylyltransferase
VLRHRLPTGAALIALLLAVAWADARWPGEIVSSDAWRALLGERAVPPVGGVLVLFTLFVVAPLLGAEMGRLQARFGAGTAALSAIAVPLVAAALLLGVSSGVPTVAAALPLGVLTLLAAGVGTAGVLAQRGASGEPAAYAALLRRIEGTIVAGAYAGGCLGGWLLLRQEVDGWVLAGGVLVVKSCDIGAYFTGRAIGRRKLVPWLSPGKTWEGLWGGVATSTLVGAGLATASSAALGDAALSPAAGAIAGALLGLAGQGGDLAESLLKRAASAKDSGRLLPGLGGVFDVMDSLLPAGLLLVLLLAVL